MSLTDHRSICVEKLKIDQRQFATTSNRKMTFTVVSSNYHLELNPR